MLNSIVLHFQPQESCLLPPWQGAILYASFLQKIQSQYPELSAKFHSENTKKLFTISNFIGKKQWQDKQCLLQADQEYCVKITFLDSEDFSKSLASLWENKTPWQIGDGVFNLNKVSTTPLQHQLAKFISKEELWAKASDENNIFHFQFLSPTFFKNGKKQIFFPEPSFFWKSLLSKFLLIFPDKFSDQELEKLYEKANLFLHSFSSLKSHAIEFRQTTFRGFTGNVSFRVETKNSNFLKVCNVMAEVAFFSGVGNKVAMGMGRLKQI